MDSRWFWVGLSTLALVGGFGILLIFINLFAVPHMLTGDFLPTVCTIVSISGGGDGTEGRKNHHTNLIYSTESPNSTEEKSQSESSVVLRRETIKHSTGHDKDVIDHLHGSPRRRENKDNPTRKRQEKVAHKNRIDQIEGIVDKNGVQHHLNISKNIHIEDVHVLNSVPLQLSSPTMSRKVRDVNESDISTLSLTTKIVPVTSSETSCIRLKIEFEDVSGKTVRNADVFDTAWSYYRVMYGPEKCPCLECLLEDVVGGANTPTPIVVLNDQRLGVGDSFPCLYEPYGEARVLASRNSIALVLNIMLWPTIVFIVGFVGLVFACLYVQREDWSACRCRDYSFYWV